MTEASSVSRTVVASATLQWDGRSDVRHDVEAQTVSEHVQPFSFRVKGPPTTAPRALPYWKTGEIGRVPAFPQQAIAWDKEATRVIFAIAPVLLADTAHGVIPERPANWCGFPYKRRPSPPPRMCTPYCLGMPPARCSRQSGSLLCPPYQSAIPSSTTSRWCCRPLSTPRTRQSNSTPRRWPMHWWSTSSNAMPRRGQSSAR